MCWLVITHEMLISLATAAVMCSVLGDPNVIQEFNMMPVYLLRLTNQ
jgi:hypothetical protein